MLRPILIFLLFSFGKAAFADTNEDVKLFLSNFVSDKYWSIIRASGRFDVADFYEEELRAHNGEVVDIARFRGMIPDRTKQEVYGQLEARVADIVVEYYGVDYLSDIADFFRTPTGERMLLIAAEEGLFIDERVPHEGNDQIDNWTDYLSLQDFIQYSAFTNTPAGKFFVENTWEIRGSLYSSFRASWSFFRPNLNQPFVLKILETDGVVEFPNRFARQTLIEQIDAVSGQ